MITIGTGSSRPASSIPVPGTSHATASSAGASVTAAKTHPGSHDHRCASRAAPRGNPGADPVTDSPGRGPRAAESSRLLRFLIIPNEFVVPRLARVFSFSAAASRSALAKVSGETSPAAGRLLAQARPVVVGARN